MAASPGENTGYDYLNHRANRENASLDSDDFADDRNPLLAHNPSENLAEQLVVRETMELLRQDQREALMLTDVAGFRVNEVATAQGVKPGTVKSRRARAREVLREAIG